MNQPKVCVIIVSYNFEKWIDTCLPSLQNSTCDNTILVVDNLSQDNTCAIIEKRYPDVVLIKNSENAGFGKANNIGIDYAIEHGYPYVFLLNQDAWVEPDTLEKLVNASENNPQYGILSPVHLNGKGDNLDFGFATYTGWHSMDKIAKQGTTPHEIPFVNAALWLIPTAVLLQTGGFALLFAHYGEDVNLAQRIRKRGYALGIATDAVGYHGREDRKVSRPQFFYSEYVYFLTEAANPFYNGRKAFLYSILASIKKAAISALKGKCNDSAHYIRISFRLLSQWEKISRTRNGYQ